MMDVQLINDGPVTILLDSDKQVLNQMQESDASIARRLKMKYFDYIEYYQTR